MNDFKKELNREQIPKMYRNSPNRNRENRDWFSIYRDYDDNTARGNESDPVDIVDAKEQAKDFYEK